MDIFGILGTVFTGIIVITGLIALLQNRRKARYVDERKNIFQHTKSIESILNEINNGNFKISVQLEIQGGKLLEDYNKIFFTICERRKFKKLIAKNQVINFSAYITGMEADNYFDNISKIEENKLFNDINTKIEKINKTLTKINKRKI